MAKITVLGSGGWGLALAITLFTNGHEVKVWSPFKEEVEQLRTKRTNEKLLKGIYISDKIEITDDISVSEGSDITVIATPSFAVGETAARLRAVKKPGIIVNVAKGFEKASCKRLSEVITRELPSAKLVVLSGPSHAEEVARGIPTMLAASGCDPEAQKIVQKVFSNEYLRVYVNNDVRGVELGGALKNIIAVAAGFCDGLELGDNSKAALITRGLSEIARLGCKLGAKERTFAGLSGLGDLIVTCNSRHSRNHRFGELLAKGAKPEDALKTVGTVEGYHAAKLAIKLAEKLQVDMPITRQCYKVMYENANANEVIKELMTRPLKEENEILWIE